MIAYGIMKRLNFQLPGVAHGRFRKMLLSLMLSRLTQQDFLAFLFVFIGQFSGSIENKQLLTILGNAYKRLLILIITKK